MNAPNTPQTQSEWQAQIYADALKAGCPVDAAQALADNASDQARTQQAAREAQVLAQDFIALQRASGVPGMAAAFVRAGMGLPEATSYARASLLQTPLAARNALLGIVAQRLSERRKGVRRDS